MKKIAANFLLVAMAAIVFAAPAFAWDEIGHKITAYIAWQRMTPDVRAKVIQILLTSPEDAQLSTFYASYGSRTLESRQREFFMLAATWPDIIRDRKFETRNKKYAHSNWHYSDTFWKVVDGKPELFPKPGEGGLAVEKLIEFDQLLRDPAVPDPQKAIAISWFEHLTGDIHQPLHASARITDTEPKGDQGGNLFALTPEGTPRDKQENLHWFWDSIVLRNIPNSDDKCDADYLDPIAKRIMDKYPFGKMQEDLSLGKFDEWRKESYEIASTRIFPNDLKRGEMPSESYRKEALKISEERLALAGYRMGEMFNQIFGAHAASPAQLMTPAEILNYFVSRIDTIIELIDAIVNVESPSHNVQQSHAVVSLIEAAALATGTEVEIEKISSEAFGEHLLIRAFPSNEKHFFLLGHTDTVHPIGTNLQNPTRIEGGKLYGCGVFDMKANIVLMLEALRFFASTGVRPRRPIKILLSCDEEVGSFTGRPILEKEAARAESCFVFEPSLDGMVKTGRKGTAIYTVRAHGVPAHAGLEPEKGANAILELSRQIEKLHELNAAEEGTTINVCTISGGTTTNVIPENAECTVDVRFNSMAESERIDSAIRMLEPIDKRVSLEVLGGINRPPMERTDAVVKLYEKARDLAASFDYSLGETQVGGASDGNFVAALGIPVLDGLGVAGAGAHTLHEHILIDDIAKRAALITMLLR